MKTYLVGGAVRDKLLNLAVPDKDFVVVGATSKQMLDLGFRQVGKDFPIFLHPKTKQQYALARTERKIGTGYRGFSTNTKAVSLQQDLSRRDLTINAMAIDTDDKSGTIIDPFGGQQDLAQGLLKHISPAFSEDAVRVLRVARFAARFKPFGFKVAHKTHRLMQQMVANGEVGTLVVERVFSELERALSYKTPSAFFNVLNACGALKIIMPELSLPSAKHQKYFTFLDNLDTDNINIKWGLLCAGLSIDASKKLNKRLKTPKTMHQLANLSATYTKFAQSFIIHSPTTILDFYLKTDSLRRQQRFQDLLAVFGLLKISVDTDAIKFVHQQLLNIDISKLKTPNIATQLTQKRKQVVKSALSDYFINNVHIKCQCGP